MILQPKPTILLFGVPHSGSSVTAKMYQLMGWEYDEPTSSEGTRKYIERGFMVSVTKHMRTRAGELSGEAAAKFTEAWEAMAKPAIVKDNRAGLFLDRLQQLLTDANIRACWIQRSIDDVRESMLRRRPNAEGWWGLAPEQWWRRCRYSFKRWRGSKRIVEYAAIRQAVQEKDDEMLIDALGVTDCAVANAEAFDVFDVQRQHPGRDGWEA